MYVLKYSIDKQRKSLHTLTRDSITQQHIILRTCADETAQRVGTLPLTRVAVALIDVTAGSVITRENVTRVARAVKCPIGVHTPLTTSPCLFALIDVDTRALVGGQLVAMATGTSEAALCVGTVVAAGIGRAFVDVRARVIVGVEGKPAVAPAVEPAFRVDANLLAGMVRLALVRVLAAVVVLTEPKAFTAAAGPTALNVNTLLRTAAVVGQTFVDILTVLLVR